MKPARNASPTKTVTPGRENKAFGFFSCKTSL